MTNYKRLESITAGDLRKLGEKKVRISRKQGDIIQGYTLGYKGAVFVGYYKFVEGSMSDEENIDNVDWIEIEQPEELDLNHLNGSIDSKLVFTQNNLDDNEIINEGLDRLYGGGIEKLLPIGLGYTSSGHLDMLQDAVNDLINNQNELIDTVNKQQEIIDDLQSNIK